MYTIQSLLDLDLSLLQSARHLIDPKYAHIVQIAGEFVVIYGALFLVSLWLYGTFTQDHKYKRIALSIFYTIVVVFVVYALINLGMPKWRPGAMEIPGSIAPLIRHPIDNSFPSGHALFTGAFLVGICRYFYRTYLLMITLLIGIATLMSRIIGGVHYPGDIIGGLIIGMLVSYSLKSVVDFLVIKTSPLIIKIASWIKL